MVNMEYFFANIQHFFRRKGLIPCYAAGFLILLLFLFGLPLLKAQETPEIFDEASFVGMTIENLIGNFGIPRSVYPVRGLEDWQDDVVFVYDEGDFYIFRDRVWQVALNVYMGISINDPESVIPLILDTDAGFLRLDSPRGSVSYSMPERSWPLVLRCDYDEDGRIRGIFIFRSDL